MGLGGALGSSIRALLGSLAPTVPGTFPVMTFAINVSGSFLLGALLQGLSQRGPDEGRRRTVRLIVGSGVLGGFTTYSTFVLEVERLLDGKVWLGIGYVAVSLAVGIVAAIAGIAAMRTAARHRRRSAS